MKPVLLILAGLGIVAVNLFLLAAAVWVIVTVVKAVLGH